uniref:hypothetical protein n=1 Tax=Mycobacterium tuberculosis TaxID=1773 RepID=UPI0027D1F394
RKLRQHKVTSDELGDYIDRVVRNFVKHRSEGERFAQWVIRAEVSAQMHLEAFDGAAVSVVDHLSLESDVGDLNSRT